MGLAAPTIPAGEEGQGVSRIWRRHLVALAVVILAVLALFHRDLFDMAIIWWTSSTYGHCLLIAPIVGWLAWLRWPELREIEPAAWVPGLLLIAVGALGWLLGDAAGVGLARHLGLVLMLQGAIIALLGRRVAQGIAFPIFYLLMLVPFGKELVPPLQIVTAKICMVLLGFVGIPAHIDGVFITTPGGYFEVAEACAGVNFVIAMFAYGLLVAHVCFLSWPRRIAFVLFAVALAILANGIRAWGTIYIAELTDISFAAGFDHVFYGWFFFAIVMALTMIGAWRFFDRPRGADWLDLAKLRRVPQRERPLAVIAAGALGIAGAALLWSAAMEARGGASIPGQLHMPEINGWQRVPISTRYPWWPRFDGADHRLLGRYRNAAGQEADLAIFVFADQGEGRELVGYGQGAADPQSKWVWTSPAAAPADGVGERITAPGPVVREVVSFYRVGEVLTGSAMRVKIETLRVRLIGGDRRAMAVIVSAEEGPNGESARPAIDALLKSLGSIDALADRVASGR